jgi:8-oxo-dGTP diphosphatase
LVERFIYTEDVGGSSPPPPTKDTLKAGIDYTGISIVFVCHDGKGNIVLQKRSAQARDEQGRWDCGGGKLELHLTPEETLRAEIKEEYCADVLDFTFIGYRDVHREQNGITTHWLALDFSVLVDREQVKNGEPHKFDEIGWFTLDTLPSPLHSQVHTTFESFKKSQASAS